MSMILRTFLTFLCVNVCFSLTIVQSQESSGCPKDTGFDFIIVGSGSAGSAIAYRLTEVPNIRVLVLEAGEEPPLITYIPMSFADSVRCPNSLKYMYFTVPQKNCCAVDKESKTIIIQGKGLGGTSNINGMGFTRGNKEDYENWKNLGNPGWGYDDVFKYFLKIEDYQIPHTEEEAQYHSKGGPVTISHTSYKTIYSQTFLEAGQELGYFVTDVNGKNQIGFAFDPLHIKNGMRWSNYKAYLEPAMKRSNINVWKNSIVTKILFSDSKTATGVDFEYKGTKCTVKARKEVIISAGALSSPKLLMLSGVGPKDVLTKLKVPVVHHLPGVGQNLIDHVYHYGIKAFVEDGSVPVPQKFTDPDKTDSLNLPTLAENMAYIKSSIAEGDRPDLEILQQTTWSLALTIRFYQAFNERNETYEEIVKRATEEYKKSFTKSILKGLNETHFSLSTEAKVLEHHDKLMLQVNTALVQPKSRGYLTLSSSDPHDSPIIDPKYLSHPDDFKALVEGFNETIRLIKTNAYKKKGIQFYDFGKLFGCGSMHYPTKEYLECMVKMFSASGFHFVGTCKMAPETDPFAVVDAKLNVHGVHGLRVADASVIPVPITGHTHAPAIMVGEKAADIIKQDWNLK